MAAFSIQIRPPPLVISKSCVYKTVDSVNISLDIYCPGSNINSTTNQHALSTAPESHPVMVFIHGGGWIGGNRLDYSRPLFQRFLDLGFVVLSVDYRLLPETSFEGQQEDIRDVEPWVQKELENEIKDRKMKVDTSKIIVVGASAGALLALLTPKLWPTPPSAILSMYGPTNLHTLPYLGKGKLSGLEIGECTSELLARATDYLHPPTEMGLPLTPEDYVKPRQLLGLHLFRKALIAPFLVNGLVTGKGGELELPERGSATVEEIDEISPLQLLPRLPLSSHPPILQIIGDEDAIFLPSHIHAFHSALEVHGVPAKKTIVRGGGHAFDIWEKVGSVCDRDVLGPGVEWIAQWVGIGKGVDHGSGSKAVVGDEQLYETGRKKWMGRYEQCLGVRGGAGNARREGWRGWRLWRWMR